MDERPNILFIMCDQLRWDYLSASGHPTLKTPHIDRLARMGVRFDRAFVQSPVCGPSRASFYTGRTVFSHGATWNRVPLPLGEMTLGDYLRPAGYRVAVAGKSHARPDQTAMSRLGISPDTPIGLFINQGGYEPFDRDDGIHPSGLIGKRPESQYNIWLRSKGYDGENPWHDWANSTIDSEGKIHSGWNMASAAHPTRVPKEHSESRYITDRGIEFMQQAGATPWLLHLSYIKPHWPYVAPAPYHALYSAADIIAVKRHACEQSDPHPVYAAFKDLPVAQNFSRDDVRHTIIPVYMGLIKQIDDEIGRVLDWLEQNDQLKRTAIVFTSDHGDYLGDHWLGDKDLFHEPSVRVPLIIFDPSARADATRGSVSPKLVEAIDLVPTFLDFAALPIPTHRLEGRTLLPLIHDTLQDEWRDCVFSELDYSFYEQRLKLGLAASDARIFMLRTERWKYIHYLGFPPQLFDLENDPDEYVDLGRSASHAPVIETMRAKLFERLMRRRNRVTMSDMEVDQLTGSEEELGIFIGHWQTD